MSREQDWLYREQTEVLEARATQALKTKVYNAVFWALDDILGGEEAGKLAQGVARQVADKRSKHTHHTRSR
jgi:hypothetical protein